jgi:hypothetical protein
MKKMADKKLVIGRQFHIFKGFYVIAVSLISRNAAGRVMGTKDITLNLQPYHFVPYGG